MSRSLEYIFPASNEQDICLLQDTNAGGRNLKLNGFLVNSTGSEVSFIERGYSRTISLTSVNDLSGVQFHVNGIQNGIEFKEIIFGPNNSTVYTTNYFDKITYIYVGVAVMGISVGTGVSGFFSLVDINLERPVINYALTLATFNRVGSETLIFATLDDIHHNGESYLDNVYNNKNIFTLKANSSEDNYILPPAAVGIYKSLLIAINGGVLDITDEIQMKFIQI